MGGRRRGVVKMTMMARMVVTVIRMMMVRQILMTRIMMTNAVLITLTTIIPMTLMTAMSMLMPPPDREQCETVSCSSTVEEDTGCPGVHWGTVLAPDHLQTQVSADQVKIARAG